MTKVTILPDGTYCIDQESRQRLHDLIVSLAEESDAGIKFMSQHLGRDEMYQCWCCSGRGAKLKDVKHDDDCPITLMRALAREINV